MKRRRLGILSGHVAPAGRIVGEMSLRVNEARRVSGASLVEKHVIASVHT